MTAQSVVHSTFVIERTYGARAARVFAAFSDEATPSFDGGDKPKAREEGCRELLEKLDEELRRSR